MSFDQVFPPAPTLTETNLPDQTGKTFLITGAAAGIGIELASILYSKNGTVYIATRSLEKIKLAEDHIRKSHPSSKGRLEHIVLDLSNLSTIRPAAEQFLAKESRLDVLFLNAAVMNTPREAKSVQGHELQMATNALGPHLLTKCLEPILAATARKEREFGKQAGVRVVWVSALLTAVPKVGVVFDKKTETPILMKQTMMNYMQTKVGNVYLCHEWMVRMKESGVVNVVVHPGFIKTELQRNNPWLGRVMGVMFKPKVYGAYSELFAGLSSEITLEKNGAFLVPWGRFRALPDHISKELGPGSKGESGHSARFWHYCERATQGF